jgi:hypothetical protein
VTEISELVDRLLVDVVPEQHRPEVLDRLTPQLRPEQRWQVVAQGCVRGIKAVPLDVQHQQAAVALVTNALAHEGWKHPDRSAVETSVRHVAAAVRSITAHYEQRYDDGTGPTHPVHTAPPSPEAPVMPLPTATTTHSVSAALSGLTAPTPSEPAKPGTATHTATTDPKLGRDGR